MNPVISHQKEQEREIVRVLLHCCLAESSWNPYYGHLALKLAHSGKSHRLTLQFALWDQYKVLEQLETVQLASLARMNAILIAKSALPLSMLKVQTGYSPLSH
jgi:nucleolar MIF4G domain-containing protein 1